METLLIEWQRPSVVDSGLAMSVPRVATSMRVNVRTPEEASRVFDALAGILRALTADQPRRRAGNGAPGQAAGQSILDPRDG